MNGRILVLLSAAVLAAAGSARAAIISVNFNDSALSSDDTYVTGTAGVVAAGNWNNVVPVGKSGSFTTVALNDSTGASSGSTISVLKSASSTNVNSTADATLTTQDDRLMKTGTIVQNGATVAQFTISSLSTSYTAGGYSVYVYVPGLASGVTAPSRFTVTLTPNNVSANNQLMYTYDSNNTWGDSFMLGSSSSTTTTESNYVVFSGLTVDNFKVQVTDSTNTNGILAGVQIVSTPATTANVTVTPSSTPIAAGGNVTINATADNGTYTVSGTTTSGGGWSQTGITNGAKSGSNNDLVGTFSFDTTNKLNGTHVGAFSTTISAAASGNGTYSYVLSTTVTSNTAIVGGPAQTALVLAGNSISGLGTTSAGTGAAGNTFTIQASDTLATNATISLLARVRTASELPGGAPPSLYSDVFDLTGLNGAYVVTLSYNDADLVDALASQLFLGWFNGSVWTNATEGNTGNVYTGPALAGSWTTYVNVGDGLANDLGRYGVDTTNKYVWAVLNHNSEFAIIPEPASLGVLSMGSLMLLRRRRR